MLAQYRIVKNALRALSRNPMRSALTCLGIIIGVAAVIAIVEIGNGTTAMIQRDISAMGSNTVLVMPGAAVTGGINWGAGSAMSLRPSDCQAILSQSPSIAAAAPLVWGHATLSWQDNNWQPGQVDGTTPAFLTVRNWQLAEGRCFTDQEVRDVAEVCVLGRSVALGLFGNQDPVGKLIRAQNVMLRVIGLLKPKGANMGGQDQDDILIAPWTTIKFRVSGLGSATSAAASTSPIDTSVNSLNNLYPTATVQLYPAASDIQQADTPQPIRFPACNQIYCSAVSPALIPKAIEQIHLVLRARHRIRSGLKDDFQVIDMTELMKVRNQQTQRLTLLLICVAMISLIVGGVGIMNIMLVSVTERTREIGLRMAVGAKSGDILRQFLIEAIVMCVLGGLTGILLGRGTSWIIGHWPKSHMPTRMSVPAILAAVVVSGAVGVIFGFYPAWKASRLDPIEALRYE